MKVLTILTVAVLAVGCSSDPQEVPDPGQPVQRLSSCSEVWVAGQTLPEDYEGCQNGSTVDGVTKDGDGRYWYDDRLSAAPGEIIK